MVKIKKNIFRSNALYIKKKYIWSFSNIFFKKMFIKHKKYG